MRKFFFLLIALNILTSCIKKENVDLIIHNANIISVDPMNNVHEAIVVKNGKIVALGKENQILMIFLQGVDP